MQIYQEQAVLANRVAVQREWCKTIKMPVTVKELQASTGEMGETEHTTTVARDLHPSELYGRVATRHYW